MPEASAIVYEVCIQGQCGGQPCKIVTDSMTCNEKCIAEASAADACEIFC